MAKTGYAEWFCYFRLVTVVTNTNGPPGFRVRRSCGGEVWKLHIFKDRFHAKLQHGAGKIGNSGVSDYEVINLDIAL